MPDGCCRFCGAKLTETFADLGMSPPSNAFLKAAQLHAMERFYPLHAWVCGSCKLVQLEEFESPREIFSEYAYFSSYSESWLKHAQAYVEMMVRRFELGQRSRIIEIASNDGYLLQYFKQRNIPVLGIEPAANVAKVALEKRGIESRVEFFGADSAKKMVADNIRADLLLGNNVLAHVPDINNFVAGMKIVLKPDGIITMEFPHLLRLMEQNQFDTIYHEHFSYLSFTMAEQIFAKHGLKVFDVEELSTHGGSIRIFACHSESGRKVEDRVPGIRRIEHERGLGNLSIYQAFAQRVKETKRGFLEFLIKAKQDGERIVGYGAAAKGNTLLNYCGVGTDFIDYVVDKNPYKQNCFLPGSHIPIHGPEMIAESRPDYVLILPWNIRDEVMEQMAHIRSWGGKFVVAIPHVMIFP
ncbi:MAG TPA: class I SAM-dependent methyltransferase [Tepidisphaeraceae bacterium]|jgi:SAM-dependent methyltransferase